MAFYNSRDVKRIALNGVVVAFFITALVLFIYMSIYTSKPGPSVYENPFIAILLAPSLIFAAAQLIILPFSTQSLRKWAEALTMVYWLTVVICGFIIFVGYLVAKNPICAGLGFLIFLAGVTGILTRCLLVRPGRLLIDSSACQTSPADRKRRLWRRVFVWLNRILKSTHWLYLVLTAAGAITNAFQERYSNPGTLVSVTLLSGQTRTMSYNCTTSTYPNATEPIIWFESTVAHGVLDFLGVQHYLAASHNRTSCSYDPPNFGWSAALPASMANYNDYFPALLQAIGQQQRRRIIVGWGGGWELALRHAIADPETTAAVVDLDAGPDGIEWLDAQRAHNWTEQQRLAYRKADISSRISLAKLVLTFGLGFGLTPIVLPGNSSQYFDRSLYPAYHAQSLRDPFWAAQYYSLLQMAEQPRESSYLVDTVLPANVKTYALLTRNVFPDNSASNDFYREQKLNMVNHVAGGKLAGLEWCEEDGCDLGFVVKRAEWTAGVLAGMLEDI